MTMTTRVQSVPIPVADQDRALEFYTTVLGCELRTDIEVWPGASLVEVVPPGRVIDERAVARATAAAGISIRTGCFCNPGAGEGAFHLTRADWRKALRRRPRTLDQYIDLLGLPGGGHCAHR
jgi:catechol 2,3-dioxygenase-like lactoylglutathione lyase family enzyme